MKILSSLAKAHCHRVSVGPLSQERADFLEEASKCFVRLLYIRAKSKG
jgi:hypothetical protein